MTATQAPTPGPLSAAIDMLSEARDFIDRFSDVRDGDYGAPEANDAMIMVHEINATIEQLSAPTAPVEASGSEREKLAATIKRHLLGVAPDAQDVVLEDDDWQLIVSALLSARPLTLGGQKGNSETLRVLLDNLVIAQTLSKDIRQKATDEARSYLYDLRHTPQPSGETREQAMSVERIKGWLERNPQGGAEPIHPDDLRALLSALSTTPARAEAQDEGAAGELKPCPFCGGEAEIIHLDDDDNAGGSCVCCTKCQASGNVEFGRKENFVENWNRRAHPSPPPAADEDRVRIAVEALEPFAAEVKDWKPSVTESDQPVRIVSPNGTVALARFKWTDLAHAAEALAALKSEGK